jgi:hypothetical protein
VHLHDTDGNANQSFAAITVDIRSIAVGQTGNSIEVVNHLGS